MRAHGRRAAVVAASLALLLSACGGSSRRTSTAADVQHRAQPESVCTPKGRATVTRFFGHELTSLTTHVGVASSGSPTCYYAVKLSHRASVNLSVQVDKTVEAYFLLERAITELQQVFAPVRLAPAPETISHLGLDASWFPAEHYVMTTDGVSLITATVGGRSVPARRQRALATAAARAYLGPLDWKAADSAY